MTLMSMTGFARSEGAGGALRWYWELKSVNARGLDVRLRLPQGFEGLEPALRERIAARIARGAVQASLQVQREPVAPQVRVNAAVLEAVVAAAEGLRERIGAKAPRLDGLLALKGVVELVEPEENEGERAAREAALLASFDDALAALAQARAQEGARLRPVIDGQLDAIARLTAAAAADPVRRPEAIRARLAAQVERLLQASDQLDADRLHQEAVLLATKADIQEELDRLDAHVAAGRELVAGGGAVGRRLDFLAQEFNREANTLCAKANGASLTGIGLELKAVVDQMREQVQNIE